MSTLKKGDLVMTEHGLAWYDSEAPLHKKAYRYVLVGLLGNVTTVDTVSPATREQVEAYLKEKGAEQVKKSWKIHGYYLTEQFKGEGYNLIPTHTITVRDFDTAPEQLAEAILMAKLLNAVKP